MILPSDVTVVDVQQVEINGKRFYKVIFSDGGFRHLRSMTSVAKGAKLPSFLDVWERDQIEQIGVQGFKDALNQAASDGTITHKFIEMFINGEKINRTSHCEVSVNGVLTPYAFDEDTWRFYNNFLAWYELRKPEFEWAERTLYSLQYGIAGRSDGKCTYKGRKPIIDFKTSKKPQNEHKQQGCGYLFCENEMGGDGDSVLIVALGAENKQGFSECFITDPYEIHQNFMGLYHKNNLINWDTPLYV